MLVIHGFLENGIFMSETNLANIKGRQKAVLNVEETDEKQKRRNAWKEFSCAIRSANEELDGEPERIRFRTPEEIEAYEIRA